MEHLPLGELIKIGNGEIVSCTILGVDKLAKALEFQYINFRKAVANKCGILFFMYNNMVYYPISMEYRLIDNNILFLIEELSINSFNDLSDLLASSFKREEGRDVQFFGVLYYSKSKPPLCIELKDFTFESRDDVIEIYEE